MSIGPLLALISFLTIIPVNRSYQLDYTARYMFLFPLIGLIIGFIVGSITFLLNNLISNAWIVALIAASLLLIITGMHHTDALADFADGVMAKGSRDDKLKALRDPAVGSAGATALILYIAGLIVTISSINANTLVAIIVSESIAKYTMVIQASLGKAAWEGIGSPFTKAMSIKDKSGRYKFIVSTLLTILIAYILASDIGIHALITSIVSALVMLLIAYRNFGGVSGDLFGATNELARLVSLIVFAIS